MVNRKHTILYSSNMLALTALLGLSLALSGCSKNDDNNNNNCHDLFRSSLLSQGLQQGSSGNSAAQLQANATTGDSTTAKVATLSATGDEVTTQAADPDDDRLVYRLVDRLPDLPFLDPDAGVFRYIPSEAYRRAAEFATRADEIRDQFEVIADDRGSDFHRHGLDGLLDQFRDR